MTEKIQFNGFPKEIINFYKELKKNNEIVDIENPADFPDTNYINRVLEPIIIATIITPTQYLGNIISLCVEKRGIQKDLSLLFPIFEIKKWLNSWVLFLQDMLQPGSRVNPWLCWETNQ